MLLNHVIRSYSVVFVAVSLCLAQGVFPCAKAREMSKAGQVFESVKDSVVTVFTGAAHGSGFLIDDRGLVLTNSHVVRQSGNNLRVRFGPGQVIEAKVIENDPVADIALLDVNLKNVKKFSVAPIFTPPEGEPLVLVGEKVIAIGSPIQYETLERTLTEGVVGKFENDMIRHDASINPGNSGGPLFNFDGQVVGINTIISTAGGPAIAGSVAISKALPLIEAAKEKLSSFPPPSESLLPDVSNVPYPADILVQKAQSEDSSSKRTYKMESRYFSINVLTPPLIYRNFKEQNNQQMARRENRARKKGFQISGDESGLIDKEQFYDYQKPVVKVYVEPKVKLTAGSKWAGAFYSLAFGAAGASLVPQKYEVKKDFLEMKLQTDAGELACTPVATGRAPWTPDFAQFIGATYVKLQEKSFIGTYEFDYHCFENGNPLSFVIETEGDQKDTTIKLPDSMKANIVQDFQPYKQYLADIESGKAKVDLEKNKEWSDLKRIIQAGAQESESK